MTKSHLFTLTAYGLFITIGILPFWRVRERHEYYVEKF